MRRTIERITWYDSPSTIYENVLLNPGWSYRYHKQDYKIRDMALIFLLYISAARVTEIVGGKVLIGNVVKKLEPLNVDQFILEDKTLWIRGLKIVKQKYVKRGSRWLPVLEARDYPERIPIPLFLDEEPFNKFTIIIKDHLEARPSGAPLFEMTRGRVNQIINEYGQFPHYYRDMGLKLWKRYFENDSFKLKKFSGHKRWSSLEKYMGEELF